LQNRRKQRQLNRRLWRLDILTTPEAEDAVLELLSTLVPIPAAAYNDLEQGTSTVSLYLEKKPSPWPKWKAGLHAGLQKLKYCGLNTAPAEIKLKTIRWQDWAESWKRHFKPIEIDRKLLVKPGWSRKAARKNQAVVILDPGLSFGTGQHPTTRFCLEQIVAVHRDDKDQSFLDIGTGSGILAIAAAKLGYTPVTAFDFDPEAVRIARENAKFNQCKISSSSGFRISQMDVRELSTKPKVRYDLVCANLISDLLERERNRVVAQVARNGVLVIAGILKREFAAVRKTFVGMGMRMIASRAENEWQSGSFTRS
jgi:ribosomal protein L11 methyltransferase